MVELQRWLLKTEPHTWSWQHQEENGGLSHWDGVRNAQAQKNLRAMSIDDLCFFYHSGSSYKEIVGIVRVCKAFYPDPSSSSAASSCAKDRSFGMVDLQAVAKFDRPVALSRLREESGLEGFALFRQPRLSVVPVTPSQWDLIMSLSGQSLPLSVIAKGTEDELPNPNSASGAGKEEIHCPHHTPLMTCLDMEQTPNPSSRRKKARLRSDAVQEEVSNPKPAIAKVEEQVSNHKSTIHEVKEQVPNHKSTIHVVEKEFPNLSKMKPKTRGNVAKKEASYPESMPGVVKEEVSNPSDVKGKQKLTANISKKVVSSPNVVDVVDEQNFKP